MNVEEPPILNVHTPISSFAVVHSITQESLQRLFDKLGRKLHSTYPTERVGAGWLKYEYNGVIWDLDDDSDYTIFVWRQQQQNEQHLGPSGSNIKLRPQHCTTLYLHNPRQPLPEPPAHLNPAYYLFDPARTVHTPPRAQSPSLRAKSTKSRKSALTNHRSSPSLLGAGDRPKFKKDFERFHSENGVRTVIGKIGHVENVRMLLKAGYRHVYMSRAFASEHGFLPADSGLGLNGYSGLLNLGTLPITLVPAPIQPGMAPSKLNLGIPQRAPSIMTAPHDSRPHSPPKPIYMSVYVSEEAHFEVVLGRSFFEKRQIQTDPTDPTDVICLDTGEKIQCELVILKDGRGEIVTVT